LLLDIKIYIMVVVAVAGGTGSVGKTLVDAFMEDGTHKVVVLARKVNNLAMID
jgi:NADP-dependent 3-hydroxy acid dehydrogenase YdfG